MSRIPDMDVIDATDGAKHDAGKDPWHLLPWGPVREVVRVLAHGAKVYAPNNWQKVKSGRDRYFNATMRHLFAWEGGELLDPDSGLPHLAHAATNVLFLLWAELNPRGTK